MGACMSTNAEDLEQKKRSQAIDRKIEEDSRKLRRECKILLLGMPIRPIRKDNSGMMLILSNRVRGEREIHHCEADEDHSSEWILGR